MKLTKSKLKEIIREELLNERGYGFKFTDHASYLSDAITKDLQWASKAIPHRIRDIKKANKLATELYKVFTSLSIDANKVG